MQRWYEPTPVTVPTAVAQVIANYTPRGIDIYHWLSIRDFVQRAVAESAPPMVDEARRRMTQVSSLADWVGYGACFPVERRTVVDLDMMGEFVDTGNGWTPKVRRMAQGRLKTMAQQVNRLAERPPGRDAYSSAWDPQPYSVADTVVIDGWASTQGIAESPGVERRQRRHDAGGTPESCSRSSWARGSTPTRCSHCGSATSRWTALAACCGFNDSVPERSPSARTTNKC